VEAFPALSSIRAKHLFLEGENLEAFKSRDAIRVTTTHGKKDVVVRAVEEAAKGIQRRKLALGNLYPTFLGPSIMPQKLKRWAKKNFDDDVLQELSRMTGTSITRKPRHKVRESPSLVGMLTIAASYIVRWKQIGHFAHKN